MKRRYIPGMRVALVLALASAASGLAQDSLRRDLARPLLAAFHEVIREPAKCTVRVYRDGFQAGYGLVVRSDGQIVTKASELKGNIQCQLPTDANDKKRDAKIIAIDPATDLALLKVDASDLATAPWSGENSPTVGTWLATLGLSRDPVSVGVVSVAARKIASDAALGVMLDDVEGMARITSVRPGMAAAKAGVQDGDIVRKCDGEELTGRVQFQQAIRSRLPGDKIALVIDRQGKVLNIEATLGSMNEIFQDERADFQNKLGGKLSERRTSFPLAIQHDSVLRPSECGGPVVDIDGKVVGLNIARAGRVESYALPTSVVRQAIERMQRTELTSAAAGQEPAARKSATGQDR